MSPLTLPEPVDAICLDDSRVRLEARSALRRAIVAIIDSHYRHGAACIHIHGVPSFGNIEQFGECVAEMSSAELRRVHALLTGQRHLINNRDA